MAKYSTGSGGGSGDGDSCELCGQSTATLTQANVAGAELLICERLLNARRLFEREIRPPCREC